MNKALLPYDVYERHKKVAGMISGSDAVLDVGGELDHLSQFAKMAKITVANLNTGDVIIKKDKLPFKEESFRNVCSIDVLEHIPKNDRQKFINDLVKISQNKIILSFPIGTQRHIAHEKKMQTYLKNKKLDVTYLSEHIEYGLPTKLEVEKLTKNYNVEITYSGNINISEYLFKLFLFDPKIKIIRKLVYNSKLAFNAVSNPFIYIFVASRKYSENVNRAYLTIYK